MGNATADSHCIRPETSVPSPMTMPKAKGASLRPQDRDLKALIWWQNLVAGSAVSCRSSFLPTYGPVHAHGHYACSVAREYWLQALHSRQCHLCCQRCGWTERKWSRGPTQVHAGVMGSEDWRGRSRSPGNKCIDSGATDMHMHSQQRKSCYTAIAKLKFEFHSLNFLGSLQVWHFVSAACTMHWHWHQ